VNAPSTSLHARVLLHNEVGYDYSRTVLEINHRAGWSYERIADFCGYENRSAIARVATREMVPSHPRGEALYILYVELFGRKPPLNVADTQQPVTT
jgi:ribosome-binding protein aMBF1 (putative translation factor)